MAIAVPRPLALPRQALFWLLHLGGWSAYFAQGYSGHGIIGSHLFGRLLGEAVAGMHEGFDTFARVPWARFPGGRRFAAPYTLLGSWWYELRDRLDM